MRKITIGLVAIALALSGVTAWAGPEGSATGGTSGTQSYLSGCRYNSSPNTLSNGQQTGLNCDNTGSLKVNASVSASVTPFTPNGNTATLAVTNASGNVALPAGASVMVSNVGSTNTAYIALSVGAGTATTAGIAIPAGGAVGLTVGSNTYINAITASSTTTLNIAGGAGLVAGFGGGGGSSGGSNAAASATGSAVPASGSYNATNIGGTLRGQTGVNPSGTVYASQNDTTSVNGVTVLTGTGATGTGSQRVTVATDTATIAGSAVGTAGTPSTNVVSIQGVASGTVVPVSSGVAQGSTTSGQSVSPIGCRTLSSAPTDTTAQTNMPRCTTAGELAVSVTSGSAGNGAASNTGSAVPAQGDYGAINIGGTLRGRTGVNPTGTVYAAQTDLSSVGGTSVALGSTTSSASIPVVIASDQGAVKTTQTPGTSGGLSFSTLTAANSTNATNLKASAGQLYHISGYSAAAVPTWITFYNNSGTPTCGTSIVYEVLIPVNSTSGGGFIEDIPEGLAFSTGIAYCVTTGIGATGSVAATSIVANFGYK